MMWLYGATEIRSLPEVFTYLIECFEVITVGLEINVLTTYVTYCALAQRQKIEEVSQ